MIGIYVFYVLVSLWFILVGTLVVAIIGLGYHTALSQHCFKLAIAVFVGAVFLGFYGTVALRLYQEGQADDRCQTTCGPQTWMFIKTTTGPVCICADLDGNLHIPKDATP